MAPMQVCLALKLCDELLSMMQLLTPKRYETIAKSSCHPHECEPQRCSGGSSPIFCMVHHSHPNPSLVILTWVLCYQVRGRNS